MTRRSVLTAIGEDRPGLVEEVSEFILECGGSIEDSRMANLQGQFAIVMLVGGADEAIDRLEAGLDDLGSRTHVHARLTPAPPPSGVTPRLPYRLSGRSLDQPGVVHQIANVLRSLNVNIESMETTLVAAPVTGAPVFTMELVVAAPVEVSVAKLREKLGRVCDPLNIEWQLTAL